MIRLQPFLVFVLAAGIAHASPSPLLGGLGGGDSAGGAGDKLGGGAFPFVVSLFCLLKNLYIFALSYSQPL